MTKRTSILGRTGTGLLLLAAFAVPALALGGTARAADTPKAVYTLTNSAAGNAVIVYARSANGSLATTGPAVSTGGLGTGGGLGSQGAVILSDDGGRLFAVNAGDNTITSFAVTPTGLSWVSRVGSGGTTPISLTFRDNLLYVLNAGSSSIAGFAVNASGALSQNPIAGSVQSLNASASSPEEIAFNPAGNVLAVTEKGSGQIDTYTVASDGSASGPTTYATGAVGPYAVAYNPSGYAIVADAGIGAASSYSVSSTGTLTAISSQVADNHAAPCWLVVTGNGKYAYTANAHDGTISSYRIANDGSLSLLQGLAAGPVSVPLLDLALSSDSHYLYGDDNGSIVAYSVAQNGSLTALPGGSGLAGGVGLAAH